jgi:hypothetical protein
MLKKIMLATVTSVFLLLSVAVHAEPVTMVFSCKLKDGSTKDDAMAINARWLKWARATGQSSVTLAVLCGLTPIRTSLPGARLSTPTPGSTLNSTQYRPAAVTAC